MKKWLFAIILLMGCASLKAIPKDPYCELVSANNLFACDMMNQSTELGNYVSSPFGVSSALWMLLNGADGKTYEEIVTVLHYFPNPYKRIEEMPQLMRYLSSVQEGDTVLSINLSLWVDSSLDCQKAFLEKMQAAGADCTQVSFSTNPAGAINKINDWVNEKTKGKIQKVVQDSDLDAMTKMMLLSSIYFKGAWDLPFNEASTKMAHFMVDDSRVSSVPFMNQVAKIRYLEKEGVEVVELSFKKALDRLGAPQFALLIIGSNEPVSLEYIKDVRRLLQVENIDLSLPKFSFFVKTNLVPTLSRLGMESAFDNRANFLKMSVANNLCVSKLFQVAAFDLDENGVEAAAVTAIEMKFTSVRSEIPVKKVVFNRPFQFYLVETVTSSILFMGEVLDPKDKQ